MGANVAILDLQYGDTEGLPNPMDAGPGSYMVVNGDVLKRDVLETAVAKIIAAYNRIDILINAAGVTIRKPLPMLITPF